MSVNSITRDPRFERLPVWVKDEVRRLNREVRDLRQAVEVVTGIAGPARTFLDPYDKKIPLSTPNGEDQVEFEIDLREAIRVRRVLDVPRTLEIYSNGGQIDISIEASNIIHVTARDRSRR